jgi:single-strand DNA-binding protein
MASVNKAIIVGRVGRDPETRYLPDGTAVSNFSVATSYIQKARDGGEDVEHTEWHRISFFGRLAEVVSEYVRKGGLVYVEGSLRTRKWEKDGQDHYSTEIAGHSLQLLARAPGGDTAKPAAQPAAQPAGQPAAKPAAQGAQQRGKFDDMADDIPF